MAGKSKNRDVGAITTIVAIIMLMAFFPTKKTKDITPTKK